jgi:hypothetical protein
MNCSNDKLDKKGIQVNEITLDENGNKKVGLSIDSIHLETKPSKVLNTFHPKHRLIPIFKVLYNQDKKPFTGTVMFYQNWDEQDEKGNQWNQHIIPGFEAVYGHQMVNISHFNHDTKLENLLFYKPLIVKTLYYPTYMKDTLNFQPVSRDFYMISVFDEDTNRDGFINGYDLRRFYSFDLEGRNKNEIVPKNYSVVGSSFDAGNDFLYIYAKRDVNKNGKIESNEPTDIFWLDLKNPEHNGIQYESK